MPKKPPLLLLPGLLCDEALWRNQVNALKNQADCRVADLARHDRIEALARAVLAEAPPQFALAGTSMGGYVAFEIMRQAPERVTRLCLLNTTARPDTPEQSERRRTLMRAARIGRFRGITPKLLPTLVHPDHVNNSEFMVMAERVGLKAFLNQQAAIINRIDSRPFLKDIRCPVQVVAGAQDALTPPEVVREIADGIKGARFDVIDRCGHLSPLEQPEKVTEIMKGWFA